MLKYHIQTIEVGSGGAGAISFNSIPQDFTDLVLKVSVRTTRTGTDIDDELYLEFNGSGGTAYSTRMLEGSGSSVRSAGESSQARLTRGVAPTDNTTANTFSNSEYYIPNYTSSNSKSVSFDNTMETNATYCIMNIAAGLWANSAAITSMKFTAVGIFDQHSTISLYGVKRGSDGVVNAQPAYGGEITTSGGYTIHTFNSSGTFTATRPLECEYLVIAGGGGTGGYYSGGGGAGGYRSSVVGEMSGREGAAEPKLNIPAFSSYSILVGAGGAGGTNAEEGLPGSNSTFATITSIGGGKALGNGTTNAGGSGGGGGPSSFGGSLTTGGTGTNGQGFNGGSNTVTNSATGGGGGAGSAGGVPSGSTGGNGGNGVTSSITGFAVARAGGGGGGSDPGPAGTATAGGGSGSTNVQASPGQPNTGGGGGGRYDPPPVGSRFGQPGGSGVVIIRYLTPA